MSLKEEMLKIEKHKNEAGYKLTASEAGLYDVTVREASRGYTDQEADEQNEMWYD